MMFEVPLRCNHQPFRHRSFDEPHKSWGTPAGGAANAAAMTTSIPERGTDTLLLASVSFLDGGLAE